MFVTLRSAVARQAVAAAFAAFAPLHPTFVDSLFDEHFLMTRVVPLLRTPGAAIILTPEWLAGAWVAQFGRHVEDPERLVAEATPVAADFIGQLRLALVPPVGAQLVSQPEVA